MKADFSKIDDVNGIITITLEENDYADKVKQQLKEIGKKHAEPGFRAGHVPAGIINKKYGKSVKYDVINKEVGNALYEYIKNEKLHVLGNPIPQQGAEFDIDAKDFELKFKVGIAPEIDTHVNKDLHVPYYNIKVSDQMIETQDNQFRRRFGKQEPGDTVDATALVKGVITELNEDGSVKEGGIVVENGIVAPEYFKNDDQKKIFEGKKVGETFTFNPAATCDGNPAELSSMLNISKEDTENHKGDFNFEIKEIIVLKPAEHNEEFYKNVFGRDDIKTEEEYKEALKELIQ
ncbi:MAG: trigger factor family protein, partial [Muribaculaceae bacterium]|nr:trigger factor family protein [Muribaculaceae bacterium]